MSKQIDPDEKPKLLTNGITDSVEQTESETMRILVVDDDPGMVDLTATYLDREVEGFETVQETSPEEALDHLDEVDAVVSDYDMPGMDGLEFLATVRERRSELPFILFTGRGSEEIASEAISKGVTDYLQKGGESSKYSVLANRLKNAVDRYWAVDNLRRSENRFSRLVENSTDVITIINESAQFEYVSPSATDILGYKPHELVGEPIFNYAHPDDRQDAMEKFFAAIEDPDRQPTVRFRFKHPDGRWPVIESRGRNLLDDDIINGFVVNSRDITSLKERERELERQNRRLRNIKKTLSHDISNPINVARGAIELYRDTEDPSELDRLEHSLDRIERLVDNVLEFSEQDIEDIETETVSLKEIVSETWEVTDTEGGALHLHESKQLQADPRLVKQIFESLFDNAINHNDPPVNITVGTTDRGFYVEDDGEGIEDADDIFEAGYTTAADRAGFGLAIAEQAVLSHGWEVTVAESETGGARFEICGVSFHPEVYD